MKSSGEIGWTAIYDPSCVPAQTLPTPKASNPVAGSK